LESSGGSRRSADCRRHHSRLHYQCRLSRLYLRWPPVSRVSVRRALRPVGARAMKRRQRGQSLIEGTLVMLVFFALLFGVIDCGQVLVTHQTLVERVRSAVRWGAVRPWDGTGEQVAN